GHRRFPGQHHVMLPVLRRIADAAAATRLPDVTNDIARAARRSAAATATTAAAGGQGSSQGSQHDGMSQLAWHKAHSFSPSQRSPLATRDGLIRKGPKIRAFVVDDRGIYPERNACTVACFTNR